MAAEGVVVAVVEVFSLVKLAEIWVVGAAVLAGYSVYAHSYLADYSFAHSNPEPPFAS
jgi:hypothetical protein